MLNNIKDKYHNLRRHKVMVLIIVVLAVGCYELFVLNYRVQINQLIVKKDSETYQDLWNSRAACLTETSGASASPVGISAGNLKAVQEWNLPVE